MAALRSSIARLSARSLFSAPASVARAASLSRPAFAAPRYISNASARDISVIHYKDGERTQEEVKQTKDDGPVQTDGVDEKNIAEPLTQKVIDTLTPTMKRFTLAGKIAVITGYV